MNERIQRLRQRFIDSNRQVDVERAVIVTDVYRENEEKPQIIKRALALEAVEVGIEMGGGPATVSARFALEVMEKVFRENI